MKFKFGIARSICSGSSVPSSSLSRTRKSAWNVASGLLFTVAWVFTGLLATPWLLHWLGAEGFGTYKVLMDWIAYLAVFELGLSGALMACLAQNVSRGDASAVRRLLAAGLHAYTWVTLVTLAVGVALVLMLPQVVSLEALSPQELQIAGWISLFPVLLTPLLIFRPLAEARQRHYLFNLLMTMQSILMTGLWVVAAWAGWGLPGQALATAVAQLPALLILMRDGIQAYGRIWFTSSDPAAIKALWTLSWPTFIHSVTERIGLIGDHIIIAWMLGPVAVVPFYLTQRLAALAQIQLQGLSNATWAGLVELHAQGQLATFRLRLLELTSTVSALGMAALGPIAAYNHHFMVAWVGSAADAGEVVTILACVNIWFWSICSLWGWSLFGTGYIGRWAPYAVVSTMVNIAVSIFGTLALGLVGPLMGTLASFLLIHAWALPRVLEQTFGLSPWTLWRSALPPLTWGLPYTAMLWLMTRAHTPWGWWGLAVEMGLAGAGGLSLWWLLSLDQDARMQWRCRFKSALSLY